MRTSSMSGTAFPAGESSLKKAIEEAFQHEKGPGSLPLKNGKHIAAIVPHGGYAVVGPALAWSYYALKPAKLVIILCPNTKNLESGVIADTWETPLGMVRADQEFLRELVAKETIQQKKLSTEPMEVQLPFLQYIFGEQLKIAPIVVSADIDLQQLALDIKETLIEQHKDATVIAISNFTVHGSAYKNVRFTMDPQKQILEFDKELIDLICQKKVTEFQEFVKEKMPNISGVLPVELLLRLLTKQQGKLEQYYLSSEFTGDEKNSVSYASIVFE